MYYIILVHTGLYLIIIFVIQLIHKIFKMAIQVQIEKKSFFHERSFSRRY